MNTRPILFSGAMARAILDGRKTQTRLVVRNISIGPGGWPSFNAGPHLGNFLKPKYCPHGTIGDRLWLRETWHPSCRIANEFEIEYRADESTRTVVAGYDDPTPSIDRAIMREAWVSPIHMPRWASRLTLEITGIRVERVQDVSEADARAEGMLPNWAGELSGWNPDEHGFLPFDADDEGNVPGCDPYDSFTARDCFARLWDSINGTRPGCSWEANPWVWIVEFRRVEQETAQ